MWREAWSDFIDVLPYLLIGIAIGSVIYGFMPTDLLEQYAAQIIPLPFQLPPSSACRCIFALKPSYLWQRL